MVEAIDLKYGKENCLPFKHELIFNENGTYTQINNEKSESKGKYKVNSKDSTIFFYNREHKSNGKWKAFYVSSQTVEVLKLTNEEIILNECCCHISESGPAIDKGCTTKYKKK